MGVVHAVAKEVTGKVAHALSLGHFESSAALALTIVSAGVDQVAGLLAVYADEGTAPEFVSSA